MSVEDAHEWAITPDGAIERWMIDLLYATQSSNMLVGLGSPRDTSYGHRTSTDFLVVLGRDSAAASAWTAVGCWAYSAYIVTDVDSTYKTMDDMVGPLTESAEQVLYIFMRTWSSSSTHPDLGRINRHSPDDSAESFNKIRKYRLTNFMSISCSTTDIVTGTALTGYYWNYP